MRGAQRSDVYPHTDGDRVIEGERVGDLLAALEDEDCRALLQAADGDAMSASELSDACDLPLSTTYRKVDTLAEVGLLEEQIRLCSSGKHTSEYVLRIESVRLSLAGDGIDLQMSHRDDTEEPELPNPVLAGAD